MKESRTPLPLVCFISHAVAARRLPASLPAASWPVKSPEYVWSERSTDRSGVVWHAWARLRTPVLCCVLCCASQQGSSVVLPSRERTGFLAAGEPGRTPHTQNAAGKRALCNAPTRHAECRCRAPGFRAEQSASLRRCPARRVSQGLGKAKSRDRFQSAGILLLAQYDELKSRNGICALYTAPRIRITGSTARPETGLWV